MDKVNICIDIDGTVTDPYGFIPFLNKKFNKNITKEEYTTLNWEELYGIREDGFYEKFDRDHSDVYGEAEILEDAAEVIEYLRKKHNVSFITARQECVKDVTFKWLERHGIKDVDVYMLGWVSKVGKAKELGCNIFIEDDPNNAVNLAENEIKVILIDTNYNKYVEHENIKRVNNWKEIKTIIDEYRKEGSKVW